MVQQREPEVVVVVSGRSSPRYGRGWAVVLALGVAIVVFGLLLLTNVWGSVRLAAILAGLPLLVAGVVQATSAFQRRSAGRVVAGVIVLLLGLMLIVWPELSAKGVAVLFGCALLVWGAITTIVAVVERAAGWLVLAAPGALLALLGLVLIAWPGITITFLVMLIGLNVIASGIWLIAKALRLRRV